MAKFAPVLTQEELNAIAWTARAVWDEVAGEVGESGTVPKSTVLEIVLDADRFFQRTATNRVYRESEALRALFGERYNNRPAMDWLKLHLRKNVFTYSRYEVGSGY